MSPPPDIKKYRHFVDRFDLPEREKIDLIEAVWHVMEGFAYRAFGLDPVQRVIGAAETKDELPPSAMLDFNEAPQAPSPLSCAFRNHAGERGRRKK